MTEENGFPDIDWDQMEASVTDMPEGFRRTEYSQDMIRKRITWDVAPHSIIRDVSEYLDLPISSEEGLEHEHEEADARVQNVMIVAPTAQILAVEASRAIVATMLVQNQNIDLFSVDTEEFNESVAELLPVIFHSAMGIISELVDFGLLHTPHAILPMGAMDEIIEQVRAAEQEDKGE